MGPFIQIPTLELENILMSFRKELKFRLTRHEKNEITKILRLKGMRSLFPDRTVKSLYFDNNDLGMFNDSEEGVLPRKKIRVRFYNDEKKMFKETKFSSIEGRYKTSSVLENVPNLPKLDNQVILDRQYGVAKPKLFVRYDRSYFQFNKIRITFDSNISYSKASTSLGGFIREHEEVMEIKAPIEASADYLEALVAIPTTRFSKYSRGMLCYY